jgi:HAD superfamily hydrolase (TIGR01549 family)
MKQYKTYIFDLDGTITDTTGIWIPIFRDCLELVGVSAKDIADDEIAKHTHDWNATVALGVKPEDISAFAKHATTLAKERLANADLFSGARDTLETLKAHGKQIAIFSSMDRSILDAAVTYNHLDEITPVIIAGTDVPRRKPYPDGIIRALQDLGVAKQDYGQVVYIGDKDTDIQAAASAGVDSILFYPAIHQVIYDRDTIMSHNPTTVITDWRELLGSINVT